MGIKFIANPIDELIKTVEEEYGNIDCVVYFGMNETNGADKLGCTVFPEDGSRPYIEIHPMLYIQQMIEILAHELAHVITGPCDENEGHSKEWEDVFENIHVKFSERLDALIAKEENNF